MGYAEAFAYEEPAQIFAEYARLTACENDGRRDLDIGVFGGVSAADYAALQPFQWPRPNRGAAQDSRFFAEGRFYHPDGKARFVATPFRRPATRTCARYPLILNTGRIRDQWHTMTRSAKTPRLMAHIGEPYVEIHPADALAIGVEPAELAEVQSEHGRAVLRVAATERQRRGSLFAPMHWTDQYASQARIDAPLISARVTGPTACLPLSPVVAHDRWSRLTCLLGFLIRRPLLLLALRLFFLLGPLQPVSLGAL
ncbi:MAG: molybdopterin oxidoreductase family protein [Stellaceae bacterium]